VWRERVFFDDYATLHDNLEEVGRMETASVDKTQSTKYLSTVGLEGVALIPVSPARRHPDFVDGWKE
jgi:hypothetical protein